MNLHIHPDPDALSAAVAERWIALAEAAQRERGRFHVALAGGSTPRRLYETLAQPGYADRVDWSAVQIFFGDERAVPPEDPDSNYRMAREALLDHVPVAAAQVHRIEGEDPDPHEAAWRYGQRLRRLLPPAAGDVPQLDLVLLGLGADGHTASLFPGSRLLNEQVHPVAAEQVAHLGAWRISLTPSVLKAARRELVLVTGDGKAQIVRSVLAAPPPEPPYPIQRVVSAAGAEWHLDRAAAAELPAEMTRS